MTKHRNVCAHGERFFNYATKDSITDTVIHRKLRILQKNGRYQKGKNDIFSEVIILKYKIKMLTDIRNVSAGLILQVLVWTRAGGLWTETAGFIWTSAAGC